MRLTLKIVIAILLGVTLLITLHSYQSVEREKNLLKSTLSRESRQVGMVLRSMLVDIWRLEGERTALSFLQRTDALNNDLQIRWVWLDQLPPSSLAPRVINSKLGEARQGKIQSLLAEAEDGRDFLFTYVPLKVGDERPGAIEIGESLVDLHGYVSETMRRSALLLAAIVICSLLLMFVVGSFWVSRPVKRLAEQADRIAAGDFSAGVDLRGSDEISSLAAAIDRMRDQLATARDADKARLESLEKLRHTERLATIGRLSAGMAHELGTPLNVIAGRAKLISGGGLPAEEVGRSARIIGEQAERMTGLMRQLLDFARRGTPRKQPVELAGVIGSVSEMLLPTAQKQKVQLSFRAPTPSPQVVADSNQLQQVLINLVMNGIQAMPDGGELAIELSDEACLNPEAPEGTAPRRCAVIAVRDRGVGIAEAHLAHLFDPFFTTKEVGQGSGLGLAIAYGIVKEHDGWIVVESEPGHGSCFRVHLPLEAESGSVDEA